MPDAETHPQPCVQNEGMHARKSRQVRRTFRHSLRDGLPLIARSPRSPGLIAFVALRSVSQDLIPASGDQDHTISPSAGDTLRRACHPRPSHPAPRFVTIGRSALLPGRDARRKTYISEKRK